MCNNVIILLNYILLLFSAQILIWFNYIVFFKLYVLQTVLFHQPIIYLFNSLSRSFIKKKQDVMNWSIDFLFKANLGKRIKDKSLMLVNRGWIFIFRANFANLYLLWLKDKALIVRAYSIIHRRSKDISWRLRFSRRWDSCRKTLTRCWEMPNTAIWSSTCIAKQSYRWKDSLASAWMNSNIGSEICDMVQNCANHPSSMWKILIGAVSLTLSPVSLFVCMCAQHAFSTIGRKITCINHILNSVK